LQLFSAASPDPNRGSKLCNSSLTEQGD